jgi:hypothetical protein
LARCQWVNPGNRGHAYTKKGIENTNTGHCDEIICPGVMALPLGSLVVIDSVHVDYHDGSTHGNVSCSDTFESHRSMPQGFLSRR